MGYTTLANTPLERPYMVGHNLYEIHTDAKLFATRVLVNGNELKLSNATGNGSISTGQYRVSGATGYPNKVYLNAYLRPGENEVKVIFDSPLFNQVKGTDSETPFIRDMYAHVVINTGQLTNGSLGTTSYKLDQLISDPERTAHILKDSLLRRFNADQLREEISVTHIINIEADQATQVRDDACEIKVENFSRYKGILSVNGQPAFEVHNFGSGGYTGNIKELIKPGKNTIEFDITELKDGEATFAELLLDCDMGTSIKNANLPEEFSNISFGSFFNHIYISIIKIDIAKAGKYTASFYYNN